MGDLIRSSSDTIRIGSELTEPNNLAQVGFGADSRHLLPCAVHPNCADCKGLPSRSDYRVRLASVQF